MPDKIKSIIRDTIKSIRKNLPTDYQQKISKQVCKRVSSIDQYRQAKHIALYMHANGEIDLSSLWERAPLQGKFCYFPCLNPDKSLTFLPATPRSVFKENQYGILEPHVDRETAIHPGDLDLVLMPLVGFDSRGNRLGMGAGYYDRTFENINGPLMLGIAYEFQHQPYIPSQDWDVALNAAITEKKVYWANLG